MKSQKFQMLLAEQRRARGSYDDLIREATSRHGPSGLDMLTLTREKLTAIEQASVRVRRADLAILAFLRGEGD